MFALLRHFAYYHYYCDYYYLRRTILFPSDVFVRRDATETVARGVGWGDTVVGGGMPKQIRQLN